ncbi:HD domain-containing protein [Flavobacterium sp. SM2513]|uniref:HD domain-containing protein n=1 Tax=Flavobacterium sp. SM2513 TaxID=3424766 RepID=UPI003D7FF4DC
MNLQKVFAELLQRIGFPTETISNHWGNLEKAYSSNSRHYHNITHLEEMLLCFETYKQHLQFPDEVLYALFYHDYIYSSTQKDNELKSAEFAVQLLPENITVDKQIIFDMILATKEHICNGVEDEKWLIDFDLKVLAKEPEEYAMYAQQIRQEFSIYPDILYHPGRKKALTHFLEKEFIYQTETFRTLFESKARANIQQEINNL